MPSKLAFPQAQQKRNFPDALKRDCTVCYARAGESCMPASLFIPHLARCKSSVAPRESAADSPALGGQLAPGTTSSSGAAGGSSSRHGSHLNDGNLEPRLAGGGALDVDPSRDGSHS